MLARGKTTTNLEKGSLASVCLIEEYLKLPTTSFELPIHCRGHGEHLEPSFFVNLELLREECSQKPPYLIQDFKFI
tara:strand:- start:563 stop:790 length:228 start_codon:yes stop_codon:yes gene_type:complete